MARTNVLTTAKRIRRQAIAGFRHQQVVLQTTLDSDDTTVVLTTTPPNSLAAGAMIGIDIELMLVVSVNTVNNTAVVIRGYMDSEAAAHTAGAMIDINPRWSLLDIVDAMRAEIAVWSPRLYQPQADTLTADTSSPMLELPSKWAAMVGVLSCVQSDTTDDYTLWPQISYKLIRGTRQTFDGATASGIFLRFTEPVKFGSIYMAVAMPFDPEELPVTGDLTDDYGLTDGQIDLLELGVKRRLVQDEHIGKQQRHAQDDSRRAEETPIGSLVPLGQLQLAQYTRRFNDEVARLHRSYPIRVT